MDIAHLIQSSVAPVFLLSGVAATLGVLTNRLSRIVDRARTLEEHLESHPGRGPQLLGDLRVLARRANYINVAISLATIAALLVALVVVTLFANALMGSLTVMVIFDALEDVAIMDALPDLPLITGSVRVRVRPQATYVCAARQRPPLSLSRVDFLLPRSVREASS